MKIQPPILPLNSTVQFGWNLTAVKIGCYLAETLAVKFQEFINKHPKGYIGHCNVGDKIMGREMNQLMPFLIGPEGDFSNEEIQRAKDSGYLSVDLSKNRLRTETAALSAVFYLSDILV